MSTKEEYQNLQEITKKANQERANLTNIVENLKKEELCLQERIRNLEDQLNKTQSVELE